MLQTFMAILYSLLQQLTVNQMHHRISPVTNQLLQHGTSQQLSRRMVLDTLLMNMVQANNGRRRHTASPRFTHMVKRMLRTGPTQQLRRRVAQALQTVPMTTKVMMVLTAMQRTRVTIQRTISRLSKAVLQTQSPAITITAQTACPAVVIKA